MLGVTKTGDVASTLLPVPVLLMADTTPLVACNVPLKLVFNVVVPDNVALEILGEELNTAEPLPVIDAVLTVPNKAVRTPVVEPKLSVFVVTLVGVMLPSPMLIVGVVEGLVTPANTPELGVTVTLVTDPPADVLESVPPE